MEDSQRVVITGLGAISSLGNNVEDNWKKLVAGESGITRITRFDVEEYRSQVGGEVKGFNPEDYLDAKEAKRLDPFCHFAIAAADEALAHAGLRDNPSVDPWRCGVIVSSGIGGLNTLSKELYVQHDKGPSRVSPLVVPMMISNMASGYLGIRYGFHGPNLCIVSACASGRCSSASITAGS